MQRSTEGGMTEEANSETRTLVRDVLVLQLKLFIEAARDIALSPVTLGAAALDLVLSKQQPPRYFRQVVELGKRSDEWIDLWCAARDPAQPAGPVDSVLNSVEEVLRDPKAGAHRARVLKRWAERQVSRARRRIEQSPPL
jgi:hypothetical protein